jgi:hemerythrin
MALFTWKDGYSVQVRQFDDQHKKLIELINQLHDAMKVGRGKEVVEDVLKALINYTATHFAAEEQMMRLHNYPGYERHRKEHSLLVARVLDVQKKLRQGDAPLSQSVMTFLQEWLTNHIMVIDKDYGPFLNGKGVA